MHAYRFRILSDEAEDFVRDIEILASRSFLDLHDYLVKLLEFNSAELASFSICNSRWYKQCEITLIDMDFGKDDMDDPDDEDQVKKAKLKTVLMADSRLNMFMEDPHQRIMYEYDYMNPQVFFIELMKIIPADESVVYPVCIKSEGILPRKRKPGLVNDALLDDGFGLDELLVDDAGTGFDDDVDENFSNELGDGFEIEEGGVSADAEEGFDNNMEESQRI